MKTSKKENSRQERMRLYQAQVLNEKVQSCTAAVLKQLHDPKVRNCCWQHLIKVTGASPKVLGLALDFLFKTDVITGPTNMCEGWEVAPYRLFVKAELRKAA